MGGRGSRHGVDLEGRLLTLRRAAGLPRVLRTGPLGRVQLRVLVRRVVRGRGPLGREGEAVEVVAELLVLAPDDLAVRARLQRSRPDTELVLLRRLLPGLAER